jgi:hypothetical protein
MWSTAPPRHCGSRPPPCFEARPTWARSTDVCAVACLGLSFAEKGNALDPAEEIVSLSPPGRAALIFHTELAPYEAGTEFTFRPNSGSGPTTAPKCQRKYS